MRGLVVLVLAAMAMVGASPASADTLWLNPHDSVAVRTGACGDRLCGWVVWANADALADARDSGVIHLIGTALLQDYRPVDRGRWKGTVFVPDMGHAFSSEIDELSPTRLKVKGCLFGGFVCKSQVWTRIDELPRG